MRYIANWMVFFVANCKLLARAFSVSGRSRFVSSPTTSCLSRSMASSATVNGAGSTDYPTEMTEDERYLFDLNGYLVVRGVLSPEEVEQANAMIDKHSNEMIERSDAALRNAVKGTKLYGTGPGRKDLGKVLEWGPDSKVENRTLCFSSPTISQSLP